MSHFVRALLPHALACLCLSACTPPPQRFDTGFLSMGTAAGLSMLATDAQQAARLAQSVEMQLQLEARDWYAFSTDEHSELRQLNAALAAGQTYTASESLIALLNTSREWFRRSDGYFDPAIAPLTLRWGFARGFSAEGTDTTSPTDLELRSWQRTRPTLADLEIDGRTVSSKRTDLQLDLGAIAKGYALDNAVTWLRAQGITDILINLGGQVRIAGADMVRGAGTVVIRAPRNAQPLAELELRDGESLATSGDYERSRTVNGKRLHHLLDPHTGAPVQHTQAVTVVAASATLADAASTALMAAGPDHWRDIARRMGISAALRVDASGKIEISTALYARLHLRSADSALISVVSLY